MKTLTLALGIFFISFSVQAQTNVAGGNVNGTWTKANSPYLIQGDITIPDGSTLSIEPGVKVEFQGPYTLNVDGQLLAKGTANDTILFTINDTTGFGLNDESGAWRGIRFENTSSGNDTSQIIHCRIEYSKAYNSLDYEGGAIYIYDFDKIKISNCWFESNKAKNYGDVLFINGNLKQISIKIQDCRFNNNGSGTSSGIRASGTNLTLKNVQLINSNGLYAGNSIIENCLFKLNKGRAIYIRDYLKIMNSTVTENGAGIYVEADTILISNNEITYNSGIGIESYGECNISNNIVAYNQSVGILVEGGNTSDKPVRIISNLITNNNSIFYDGGGINCFARAAYIINNVIANNSTNDLGGGIYFNNNLSNSIRGEVINNTLMNNEADMGGGAVWVSEASRLDMKNSIVWGNTSNGVPNQIGVFFSTLKKQFSNIEGGKVENGNIADTPKIVSPTLSSGANEDGLSADWSLKATSPCINAGNPDTSGMSLPETDFAGNERISKDTVDMGASEYKFSKPNGVVINKKKKLIEAYPSPVNDLLNINIPELWEKGTLSIYNILGAPVYNAEVDGAKQWQVKMNDFSAGVYIVTLGNKEKVIQQKIIKQ